MEIETALDQASLTRVEQRDPYNLYHKVSKTELQALTPSFRWEDCLAASGAPPISTVEDMQGAEVLQGTRCAVEVEKPGGLESLPAVASGDEKAAYLSSPFVGADFNFNTKYLRGVDELLTDGSAACGVSIGKTARLWGRFLSKLPPAVKQRTVVADHGSRRGDTIEIKTLPWMGAATKEKRALEKLHAVLNKVGYPAKWRDYSPDESRATISRMTWPALPFESRRQVEKIGKTVDRGEWEMTPPTVNAYYDDQMNTINFLAGSPAAASVRRQMDDAPNSAIPARLSGMS